MLPASQSYALWRLLKCRTRLEALAVGQPEVGLSRVVVANGFGTHCTNAHACAHAAARARTPVVLCGVAPHLGCSGAGQKKAKLELVSLADNRRRRLHAVGLLATSKGCWQATLHSQQPYFETKQTVKAARWWLSTTSPPPGEPCPFLCAHLSCPGRNRTRQTQTAAGPARARAAQPPPPHTAEPPPARQCCSRALQART